MKLLKWFLAALGLTVLAVLALLTASNRGEAREVFVGDRVLDVAVSAVEYRGLSAQLTAVPRASKVA